MARSPGRPGGPQGLPVVFLMGPTAAGKTAAAVHLAGRLPLDIVSVDSAMVYRGMDIGTGKPDAGTLARAPHRLVDIRDPEEGYSAAQFRADALREIDAIHAAGRVPLLVGGTGLYFRALRQGLCALPSADPALRARLSAEAESEGWPALHRRLAAVDPHTAQRVHPNDPQRIQRALEVHALTGRPMSVLRAEARRAPFPHPLLALVLMPADRAALHRAIERRFHAMLAAGLVDEVRALAARPGLDRTSPAMRSVGYRQVWTYLLGETDRAAMVARAVAATRQLAKRQITWLRAEPDAQVMACEDPALHRRLEARLAALGTLSGVSGG